jgi:hypothetical protein
VAETKRCSASTRTGRMAKARQFLVAAETVATVIDDQEILTSAADQKRAGRVAAALVAAASSC